MRFSLSFRPEIGAVFRGPEQISTQHAHPAEQARFKGDATTTKGQNPLIRLRSILSIAPLCSISYYDTLSVRLALDHLRTWPKNKWMVGILGQIDTGVGVHIIIILRKIMRNSQQATLWNGRAVRWLGLLNQRHCHCRALWKVGNITWKPTKLHEH